MLHFHERDFLLASDHRARQVWAERYLDFPPSADEAWRLASYEFFRERFQKRLLEEQDTALDLRPDRDEDPESPEYKDRLLSALVTAAEDGGIVVGAAVVHEGLLFRLAAITAEAHPNSTSLRAWSLNRAPVLPDQVVESANILREAHAAALMELVASHGMSVTGSGYVAPNSGVVDPVASQWVDWAPLQIGFDLESCRRTLRKGIKEIQAIGSNPCMPSEQGHYYPPLDNAIYSPETVGWLRAKMDRDDRQGTRRL